MKICSKSQISIFEMAIVFTLFLFVLSLMFVRTNVEEKEFISSLESAADAIYFSENYRDIVMGENLELVGITQDWTRIETFLEYSFGSYEIFLYNGTHSKSIFNCEGDFKSFTERFFYAVNGSEFDFRVLKLGVCY